MQFAQPLWLLAGLAACAFLIWRYRQFQTHQRAALARFAALRLLDRLTASVSPARRKVKQTLFILGVFCLFVALARPQAGYEWQETHRKGLELLFAVDTSKSMLAQDVKPDRLTHAKLAVHDLVDKLNGDGVGLLAFAGNAFLQCPVTLDYDAFRESLDALDTKVIPRGGTDIAAAIREAGAVFRTRSAKEKILVLITDGEDLGGEGVAAAKEAARSGIKIFTVGVGSTTGELVPVPNENGGTDFVRDASGQLVKSHLDEATLKQIADATGGLYRPLGQQGEGLSAIYDQGLGSFTRHDLSSRQAKVFLEQFHWALVAALACFVAEMLIGTRRKVRKAENIQAPVKTKPAWAHRPANAAVAALGLALLGAISTTRAASPQAAEQAYQKGDFAKSQQDYAAAATKAPAKTELQFNAGSAAYKAGDLAQAAAAFRNSLRTEEVPVQQGAYYNLGNTQYRLGQKTEKSNPKETIETWGQAVRSYDAALQIEPGDVQAKHNRDLVKRKIDQLKKQEEQKQQQQPQKNDSKDQKSDPRNQQAGQNGQEPKDQQPGQQQQQARKNDAKDQKSDPGNQQAGQNGQEPKDQQPGQQQQQAQKNDAKDQKSDPGNQQAGQNGQEPKDQQPGQQQQQAQKNDSKDQKSDARNQRAEQNGDEPNDQKKQDQAQNGRPNSANPDPLDATGKKPSQGQPRAANGQQPDPGEPASAGGERREAGQMTKEEARQLLDALKNDERKPPAMSMRGQIPGPPEAQRQPLKDW